MYGIFLWNVKDMGMLFLLKYFLLIDICFVMFFSFLSFLFLNDLCVLFKLIIDFGNVNLFELFFLFD